MARLEANQFKIPTPVQAAAIAPALEGRDVLATAQTGTGKTLSFLIPIVEMLQKTEGRDACALIVLPTRELAMQIEKSFRAIRTSQAQTVALVVGGMSEQDQLQTIRRGVRLIVATPGRLEDFLKRKLVRLAGVKILVLDEVDRMLDMGFEPAIRRIVSMIPKERQTLCYSATLEGTVKEVSRNYLNNPVRIEIGLSLIHISTRPDLAALNHNYAAARQFSTAERDLWMPTVSALAAVGGTPVRADQIQSSWYGAVGANISIPVFNGFLYNARAQEAKMCIRDRI